MSLWAEVLSELLRPPSRQLGLHRAASRSSLEAVSFLYKQQPAAISEKDASGQLPLHVAAEVAENPSLPVVSYLCEKWEGALQEKDNNGCLPLHRAAVFNPSLAVVSWLCNKWDDALQKKNGDGWLPLHCAAATNPSLEIVSFLCAEWEGALQEKSNDGKLPLHCAAQSNASLEIVKFLYGKLKGALQDKSHFGALPLHFAAKHNPSLEVLGFLCDKHPDALQEMDDFGDRPLHLAASRRFLLSPHVLDFVRLLYQRCPDAVQMRNKNGYLPLHIACEADSLETIMFVANAWLDALWTPSDNGKLPIDIARERRETVTVSWLEEAMKSRRPPFTSLETTVVPPADECRPSATAKSPPVGPRKRAKVVADPCHDGAELGKAAPSAGGGRSGPQEAEIVCGRGGTSESQLLARPSPACGTLTLRLAACYHQLKAAAMSTWDARFSALSLITRAVDATRMTLRETSSRTVPTTWSSSCGVQETAFWSRTRYLVNGANWQSKKS
jgi:ankyrin repeat protein